MADIPDLDVALVPVWGWGPNLRGGHMDPRMAAEALTLLRPRVAVPIHWGTFWPKALGLVRPDRLRLPGIRVPDRGGARSRRRSARQILAPGERFVPRSR